MDRAKYICQFPLEITSSLKAKHFSNLIWLRNLFGGNSACPLVSSAKQHFLLFVAGASLKYIGLMKCWSYFIFYLSGIRIISEYEEGRGKKQGGKILPLLQLEDLRAFCCQFPILWSNSMGWRTDTKGSIIFFLFCYFLSCIAQEIWGDKRLALVLQFHPQSLELEESSGGHFVNFTSKW